MPKPMDDEAGNGYARATAAYWTTTIPMSLATAEKKGSKRLEQAVAGCLKLMADSMLIFAPSFNAFRRFQPGNHAPTMATWGWDNRTTAIRIPAGPPSAKRIEHRVAGADANPYLALAAVLAGVLHGIENKLKPVAATEGNAWQQAHTAECLPTLMDDAILRFSQSADVARYLGSDFQTRGAWRRFPLQ